jgi:hypothetical protein
LALADAGTPSASVELRGRNAPDATGFGRFVEDPTMVPGALAADGPMQVAVALDRLGAGETAVVADVCNTGHMAVVVVRKAA